MVDEYERRSVILFVLRFYKGQPRLLIKSSSVDSGNRGLALTPLLVQRDLASLYSFPRAGAFARATDGRW